MKNLKIIFTISLLLINFNSPVFSATINETDTKLCESFKYALIISLREPVDKAIVEIYKNDKNAPEGLAWAPYNTEILKIKQTNGVGGTYELTLKVTPYYRAHITYGEDEIVVNTNGTLLHYKHLKTYPKIEFD
ncbi:DUF3888 domain-containing protein [Bacillus thuringiensis]|uniref:DUF3888 domain-containing protein n=1 Tax=Bacillus thuringiensis TaxID=1428 RepID=UPI000E2E4BDE|nr:DUF3888 domain-containing protein [Bacillus thuringiensis]RFB51683.1 DUF3888 domain-containing protein [Bacillus thuringiensis]